LGVCRLQLHFNPCCFNKLLGLLQRLGSGPRGAGLGTSTKERTAVLESVQPERAVWVMAGEQGAGVASGAVAVKPQPGGWPRSPPCSAVRGAAKPWRAASRRSMSLRVLCFASARVAGDAPSLHQASLLGHALDGPCCCCTWM